MSGPVPERFNYALRPAKTMQRKMLCVALSRLARIAPLLQYRYVGLGGLTFRDFAIFHQRLGIRDMVSIERRLDAKKRFRFNRPYSCVGIEWGNSQDVLPTLDWTKRAIAWLDYEGHLNAEMLQDIGLVVSQTRSGSAVIVTVCAAPGEDSSDTTAPHKRFDKLQGRVGAAKIPIDVQPHHLAKWGTANVYRRIITDQIEVTLSNRNAALAGDEKVKYQQLFNFQYEDGVKMLTVGGIISNSEDAAILTSTDFKDLKFVRTGEGGFLLRFPTLTLKETRHLNSRLPGGIGRALDWLPKDDRLSYRELYRYFPNFVEAEI
jgi:hypothetical protein